MSRDKTFRQSIQTDRFVPTVRPRSSWRHQIPSSSGQVQLELGTDVGVVGEVTVHPGRQERTDLALQIAVRGRVRTDSEVCRQEAVLLAEGPADHCQPDA